MYNPEVEYKPCVQEVEAGASEFQNDPEVRRGGQPTPQKPALKKLNGAGPMCGCASNLPQQLGERGK